MKNGFSGGSLSATIGGKSHRSEEGKNMSRKIAIVCLWLLFSGSAVGQSRREGIQYFEGVVWGIDTAITVIEGMDTKEGMIRELWEIRKEATDSVRSLEAGVKAREEYDKRMRERIEATDSIEELNKISEEVAAERRRLEEKIEAQGKD